MGLAGVPEEEAELAQGPGPELEQGLVWERAEESVLVVLVAELVLVRLLVAAAELQLTSGTAHKHHQNV